MTSDVPQLRLQDIAFSPRGWLAVGEAGLSVGPGGIPFLNRLPIIDLTRVTMGPTKGWILGDSGALLEGSCTASGHCEWSRIAPPEGRTVADIAALSDDGALVVGGIGLVASWQRGRWHTEALPQPYRTESLRRVIPLHADSALAFGDRAVFLRTGRAAWRRLGDLPPQFLAKDAAVAGGWIAMTNGRELRWSKVSGVDSLDWHVGFGPGTAHFAVHALPDGRIVVGISDLDDPAIGGRLDILSFEMGYGRLGANDGVRVPLQVDVLAMTDNGRYLFVAGGGGMVMRIPIDSLR